MNRLSLMLATVLISSMLMPLRASADDEVQNILPWIFDDSDQTLTPSLLHKKRHHKTRYRHLKAKQRIWDQDDPLDDGWAGRSGSVTL